MGAGRGKANSSYFKRTASASARTETGGNAGGGTGGRRGEGGVHSKAPHRFFCTQDVQVLLVSYLGHSSHNY